MATVQSMTLSRLLELEAANVVDGHIDGAGHLILTRHDGTTIDAGYMLASVPDASTTVKGIVELATEAETTARTDTTRAVTPASLVETYNALNARLASLEDKTTLGMTGEVKLWSSTTTPSNWLVCDGTAVNRTTYSALFAIIGTTYGVGNGSTTFNLPDLRSRVPVGYNSSETEFNTMGKTGGAKTHTLTSSEMPSHTHIQNSHTHGSGVGGSQIMLDNGSVYGGVDPNGAWYGFHSASSLGSTTPTNQNTGGGTAHNNLQPYIALRYIIKT